MNKEIVHRTEYKEENEVELNKYKWTLKNMLNEKKQVTGKYL